MSPIAANVLANRTNDIYLSAASTWEISIKVSRGKLTLAQPVSSFVVAEIAQNQFEPLVVTLQHTYRVSTLPLHHKDPFDRLLIAQAQEEGLVILTRDPEFAKYQVQTLW